MYAAGADTASRLGKSVIVSRVDTFRYYLSSRDGGELIAFESMIPLPRRAALYQGVSLF